MPKERRLRAHQAYIVQPVIQTGYRTIRGGLGTVVAIVIEQPIDIAQARLSRQKRNLLLCQSSLIHPYILYAMSIKVSYQLFPK
jgi:hypothetical protein